MTLQLVDGKFRDSRWQEGRWVLESFKDNAGSMDWDKVTPCNSVLQKAQVIEQVPITFGEGGHTRTKCKSYLRLFY